MGVHSVLSSRLVSVFGIVIIIALVVGAAFALSDPLTGDVATAATVTIVFVALAVGAATALGVAGRATPATEYW